MQQEKDAFEDNLQRVLTFLQTYIEAHRIPPSQREIALACHLSKGSVTRCLDVLQARHLLDRNPGQPRTIRLLSAEETQD